MVNFFQTTVCLFYERKRSCDCFIKEHCFTKQNDLVTVLLKSVKLFEFEFQHWWMCTSPMWLMIFDKHMYYCHRPM